MVNNLNFNDILRASQQNFRPFAIDVKVDRKPKNLISCINEAKRDGRNPVIAEIKPASPVSGMIREIDAPGAIAGEFERNGACGVSVLTEPIFFRGSLNNLRIASSSTNIPVLRKDFLFDLSQIKESYYYGADSILLIAAFFDADKLSEMIHESRKYGMEPMVEVHDRSDAERASSSGALLYAINNRDKDTLRVDLNRTKRLSSMVKGIRVSASGIETPDQLQTMLEHCDAVLIGSSLMRSRDPGMSLRSFVYGGS